MANHRFTARIGLALIGMALYALPASAEKLRIAVAQPGFWNSSFIDFAQQDAFFVREELEIDAFYTEGGASTLTPLIAGSVDVAISKYCIAAAYKTTSGPWPLSYRPNWRL